METTANSMNRMVAPYHPTVPLDQLVEWLNRLYHAVEAASYDETHPEIHAFLPSLWQRMIQTAAADCPFTQWSILDFGCGTGFEAEQMLANLPLGKIARLICYDPSPEMLDQCRTKIASRCPQATFVADLQAIAENSGKFNVLLTNSLLHHLPKPWDCIGEVLPMFSKDAVWLQGHEPSRRFYKNRHCEKAFAAYRRRRWVSPRKYVSRLCSLLLRNDPATVTAKESHRLGLFARKPPVNVVRSLVDFHVPHAYSKIATSDQGFDFEEIQKTIADQWRLKWVETYSYMGNVSEHRLSSAWKKQAAELKARFPLDGANFCCVWERV